MRLTKSQKLIAQFKKSSDAAQSQGMARLKFEDTVKRAEKKIIENARRAVGQDTKKLAQSYAEELMHTPGSILTEAEINWIYQYTGCDEFDYTAIKCDWESKKWRRANGECNNILYPSYGAVGTQMRRLVPSQYEDGISKPRGSMQKMNPNLTPFDPPIPSPRVVSRNIMTDMNIQDNDHTHMMVIWGQFLDHELDAIPEYVENDCPHTCELNETLEGRCAPIPIRANDINVEPFADHCLGFHRSLPACNYDDTYALQDRQHSNSITHWIDGSVIYNHDEAVQNGRLRSNDSGKLILELDGE
jgi:hypothetical protein